MTAPFHDGEPDTETVHAPGLDTAALEDERERVEIRRWSRTATAHHREAIRQHVAAQAAAHTREAEARAHQQVTLDRWLPVVLALTCLLIVALTLAVMIAVGALS